MCVCFPVSIVALDGAQIELATQALVNNIPSWERRSIFGVFMSLALCILLAVVIYAGLSEMH